MAEGSRVSLVTGAGSGIGRAIAEKLAREGERVVVNDLEEASAEEVVAGIEEPGGEATSAPGDVSDPEAVGRMVERAREYITAGDIFQVVLSQRVDVPSNVHPFTVYRALRTINPSPYMFYFHFGDHHVVGCCGRRRGNARNSASTKADSA